MRFWKTLRRDALAFAFGRICGRCMSPVQRFLVLILSAGLCHHGLVAPSPSLAAEPVNLRIGAKEFTESVILAEILAGLAEDAGVNANVVVLGGTPVVWNALRQGEIDAYVEYTGTLRQQIFQQQSLPTRAELVQALHSAGVRMSPPLGFNNTYGIGVSPQFAQSHPEVTTISDLRGVRNVRYGFSNEFMQRGDGWPSLSRTYGLPTQAANGLEHALAYRGLASGGLDVIDVYTTDSQIDHYNIQVLRDDRSFFPDYDAVILYREGLQQRHPGVHQTFLALVDTIDESTMRRLNGQAMTDQVPEKLVAARFLKDEFGIDLNVNLEPRYQRVLRRTGEHLVLVGVSVSLAIFVAVPLGVLAAKTWRIGQLILSLAGLFQTIPSLVLFVMLIPLLGIGPLPVIFALFLYSLLPIVRNTHAGLHDIPGPLTESAMALGLPALARLRLVELPLAARSILAGIKTAVVINVGTATLGGLINAGGYGDPIFTGIRLDRNDLVLEGAIPAAVLALAAQGVFELAERLLVSKGLQQARHD